MRILMLPVVIAVLALAGCGVDYDDLAKHRLEYAKGGRGDIYVAAIEESWSASYLDGIRLAIDQINARPGKLLGRNVRLLVKEGVPNFDDSLPNILKIAKNPKVTAVLGHRRSVVAVPASVIYEASQIIYLPPYSTSKDLTSHNFKFVFRMVPSNSNMAGQLSSVAALLGYKKSAMLYAQDDNSRELAFLFEDAAIKNGIGFLHRRSYDPKEMDYRSLITQFANKPFDFVFISAATAADGARMVQQLREMGVKTPLMGSDALDGTYYKEAVGEEGYNTIIPVVFRPNATNKAKLFAEAFVKAYGREPDQNAALGFDSMMMLASAIEAAKSTVPTLVSSTLHYMHYWTGVTGVHAFDVHGDVIGMKYFVQVLNNKAWHLLPGVHLPFFLSKFDRYVKATWTKDGPPPSFEKAFSANLHFEDLRILQLDFLREILQFKRLGVIFGEQKAGVEPERVTRIRQLGEKRGYAVQSCGIPVSGLDKAQTEQRLINCYGKLAIEVDTMNVTGLQSMDKDMVVRVQRPLKFYKVPVLALQGDPDFEEGVAMRISRFGETNNIQTDFYVNLFGGVLNGIKVFEIAERLQDMPVMAVNLKVLNEYGLLNSGTLVGLAPDLYMDWLVSAQKPTKPTTTTTEPKR